MKISQKNRLYSIKNPIVAITGGIATGKSYICSLIKDMGFPVISADQQIKLIYKEPKAIEILKEFAPEVLIFSESEVEKQETINFKKLRTLYFEDAKLKNTLNQHIYSELEEKIRNYCHLFNEKQVIYYEIPLLYEKKLQEFVDFHVLIYADRQTQEQRVRERDGSSQSTIEQILKAQIPIDDKKELADFIIYNQIESTPHLKKQLLAMFDVINAQLSI